MSNKLLVCFWGKLKFGDYCRNNPFMLPEAYENDIHGPVVDYHFPLNLKTLMDNYKKQFPEFEIDFLLSTWDNVDTTQYESELKYLLKYPEPTDWESFLDEKGFPHTGSIRHHPEYHVLRPGPYTRLFHILNISNFLRENNIKYDGILFSRTDIYFEFMPSTIIDFSKDVCYLPKIYWGSKNPGHLNDHIIVGKYEYVLRALHIESVESEHAPMFICHNPESYLYNALVQRESVYEEFECIKYCRFPLHMQ